MILEVSATKKLIFDEDTKKGEIIDTIEVQKEIDELKIMIAQIETDLKDDKKMLAFGKEHYPIMNNLQRLKDRIIEKEEQIG